MRHDKAGDREQEKDMPKPEPKSVTNYAYNQILQLCKTYEIAEEMTERKLVILLQEILKHFTNNDDKK